jgi:predicted nuclease of predicted toxin-antitoxin system
MLLLLIDEHVHGAILDGLRNSRSDLDIVRVQDVGLGSKPDSEILAWAANQGRVVISLDKKTLAVAAWQRVAHGLPMPGVAILRRFMTIGQAIQELELVAAVGTPDDFQDLVVYLPL